MAELRNGYSLNPRALWVGEVPDVWEFFKGKYVFGERFEKGNEKNLELLSPTQKYGVIPQSMYDKLSGMRAVKVKESTDLALFKTVHTGDFCISLRSFQGGFEYSRYEGVVSPAYHILFPKKNIVDGYYKYLFKETSFIAEMNSYCQSLRDGKNISYEDFGKTVIPYPPLDEQRAIADYLDERCSKIDEIISEATASIEEYKKLKQSVIFEAVTKGLNKKVLMKDSGVEWIGKIPAHWKMGKIKNGVTKVGSGKTPKGGAEVYSTEGVLFLRSQNIYDEGLKLENPFFVSDDIDKDMKNTRVQPHDVLLNITGGSIGRCCVVPNDLGRANVNQHVSIIRARTSVFLPEYLHLFWISPLGKIAISLYQTGGNREGMSAEAIKNTPIQIPPIVEQIQIVKTLKPTSDKFDAIISEKQALIDDLQAYKKSLIYEVVTGKRRVV